MNKKQCFCGCSSFWVYQRDDSKGQVMFKCQSCKCERRVNSPGISATQYDMSPDLLNYIPLGKEKGK